MKRFAAPPPGGASTTTCRAGSSFRYLMAAAACAALLLTLLAGCGGEAYDPPTAPREIVLCGGQSTPIHAIQGTDDVSPMLGQEVQVEGVATLPLSGEADRLLGVFVEAPGGDRDVDKRSSEGLFAAAANLQAGRLYRLSGRVSEWPRGERGLTAVEVTSSIDCGPAELPPAERLALPLDRHIESLEGMRVVIAGPLTVSGNQRLGSHAEIVVAAEGRLYQPTEIARPGKPAERIGRANLWRSLVLDDASTWVNSGSVAWWPQPLDSAGLPRAGDTIGSVSGVMDDLDGYRLHLSEPLARTAREPRPAPPQPVNNLRVATFNLLNFFNGNGHGEGFPAARGAASAAEFERQKAKILTAMTALDADLFALAELENDAANGASAVAELAASLGAASGRDYRAVANPVGGLGGGAIAVGLVFDASTLTLRGEPKTTRSHPFDDFNRPPLLATFEYSASGRLFSAVAVHFKSKSCDQANGANRDSGDGQGCWNDKRIEAARALTGWIGSLPGVEPANTLLLGDYNAYSQEEPLAELRAAGYHSLRDPGTLDYTFVYRGRAGALDHAYAGSELAARLKRSVSWHINADESAWIDYRTEGKPAEETLYDTSAFRSSDHDPLILEFDL